MHPPATSKPTPPGIQYREMAAGTGKVAAAGATLDINYTV
jgi:hypothetical protein